MRPGSVKRGQWPPLALSHLSPKYAEPLRVALTSLTEFHVKTKQLTEVLELASTLSFRGTSWPGLRMGTDALPSAPFLSSPPQISPKPHTFLPLPFSKLKLLYVSIIEGWNTEGQLGRWGLDVLCIWVRAHSSHIWRIPGSIIGICCLLNNGRFYYHRKRKSHFLSLRCYKFFKVQLGWHFLQEDWL